MMTTPHPDGVVEKGEYEALVYAHAVTARYADHLPLHRIQGMFRRQRAHLPQLSMWALLVRFDEVAAQSVRREMSRQPLEERELPADETTISVQTAVSRRRVSAAHAAAPSGSGASSAAVQGRRPSRSSGMTVQPGPQTPISASGRQVDQDRALVFRRKPHPCGPRPHLPVGDTPPSPSSFDLKLVM
jgi:hypothetical protein